MPLNELFYQRQAERIEAENMIFSNFSDANCGCWDGFCICTVLEKACWAISRSETGDFNEEQREIIRGEAVYMSEGGYKSEEIEKMNDLELANVWLETASDYANGQL